MWRRAADGSGSDPRLYSAPPQRSSRRAFLTGPVTSEPSTDAHASTGTSGMRDSFRAIGTLLAAGFVLRLIIAYLLPGSGFKVDLGAFEYWAHNLSDQGPLGFYNRGFFADYTPGYLYVLWLVGLVGDALAQVGIQTVG